MVQARITKSSSSAAWKTLVSGTVKLFHKFERGQSPRTRVLNEMGGGQNLQFPANTVLAEWDRSCHLVSTGKQEIWVKAHEARESLWQFRFISLAKNWGVHAKLIYKYQILYLDCITIAAWRHLVNDIDLCHSPKSPKKIYKTPYFGIQCHWIRC